MPTVGTTPFYNEIILSHTIAFYDLYALVEFILWYERHNLSEYGLSLIHDFSLLQYNLQKYKKKHYDRILNFFNDKRTNASAESFNCKLKTFRAEFRGVNDLKFYLYRVKQLFA